ncbi:MAG: putative toxin-antitoxin system toxin component, PIN family [Chitinophagales bacterium]|nr:putative toxin-antitoxin system toxin component, PIN family [Chitinophagales bacterium]
MRVVLDTNILLVSIPINSRYRIIFDALLSEKYELLISNEVFLEYQKIISAKANAVVAVRTIDSLSSLKNVLKCNVFYNWNLIAQDFDDNKFVDLYVAAEGDYLVSVDSHFNVLKKISFPKVNLIDIEEFVEILKQL